MEEECKQANQFIQKYWPDFDEIQEQLEKPTPELVIDCYQRFRGIIYKLLSETTGEDLQVPSLENDSIRNLLCYINRFLKNRTKQDGPDGILTLTDLYAPTSRRTKIRMKLLMNMLVVFYGNIKKIRSVAQKQKQFSNAISLTRKQCQQLQMNVAEEAENLAKNEDVHEKLQKKLKQTEIEHQNLQEQKEDKQQNCKQLQQELKTALETYQCKQKLVKNLKANIANYNEQVVCAETYKSLQDLNENLRTKSSVLMLEENYTTENLSVKKPDINRFTTIYKEIDLMTKDASTMQLLRRDIATIQNEIKLLETNYNKKYKEIENKRKSVIKLKNNIKETNASCQSTSNNCNMVVQKIFSETEVINVEINEEMDNQKKLSAKKKLLEQQILESKRTLTEIQNSARHIHNISSGTYERIITAENPLMTQFATALNNIINSTKGH